MRMYWLRRLTVRGFAQAMICESPLDCKPHGWGGCIELDAGTVGPCILFDVIELVHLDLFCWLAFLRTVVSTVVVVFNGLSVEVHPPRCTWHWALDTLIGSRSWVGIEFGTVAFGPCKLFDTSCTPAI